jgi:DNA-binding NarL/FixJ family response regulator
MSEPALATSRTLRVHLDASDAARRAVLAAVIVEGGHTLSDAASADVILSDGDHSFHTGVPMVSLGASDDEQASVLPAHATPAQVDAALRAAAVGLIVRSRDEAVAFERLIERPETLLTPRETEVLALVADGLSNKEIARRLEISLHTVKFHVESLLRKLGARSRAEAVAKAIARRRASTIEL